MDEDSSGTAPENVERGQSAEDRTGSARSAHAPRRRRRRIVVAISLLSLVALVLLTPRILSSGLVLRYALNWVSGTIRGRIECDGASLSWTGPCVVRGIAVFDERDRPVARVDQVRLSPGLLGLLRSQEQLGEILLSTPAAELLIDETGSVSLLAAIESVEEAQSEAEPAPLPSISASVRLESGRVRVVRGDEKYELSDLGGSITLTETTDIDAELSARLTGGEPVELKINGRGLTSAGAFSLASASGTAALVMPQPANLGPLVSTILGSEELSGTGRVDASVRLEPGTIDAEIEASGKGIRFAGSADALAHPIDAVASSKIQLAGDRLSVQVRAEGEGIAADFTADYPIGAGVPSILPSALVDAALGGDGVALPQLKLDGSAEIDLAAIDRALPGVLPLRPGQSLVSGRFVAPSLKITGGSTTSLALRAELVDVTTSSATGTAKVEPIALEIDARLPKGSGIVLDRGELRGGFGSVRGQGSLDELASQFDTDLTALTNQLAAVVDLGALGLQSLGLQGRIQGTASLRRSDEAIVETSLTAEVSGFAVATGGASIELERGTITEAGRLALSSGRFVRADVESFRFSADEGVIVDGKGVYQVADGGLTLEMNVERAELGYVAKHLNSFDVHALDDTTGSVRGAVTVARASNAGEFTSSGSLTATRLSQRGAVLTDAPVEIEWTDLSRDADGVVKVIASHVRSALGEVRATDVRLATENLAAPGARLEGWIDIAKAGRAASAFTGAQSSDGYAGRLAFLTVLAPSGGAVRITGTANCSDVVMRVGDDSLKEPSVALVYDVAIDESAQRATINSGRISTARGNVDLSGTVSDLKTAMNAKLRGRFDAKWRELTPLLHTIAPSTANLIAIEGDRGGTFEWDGPLTGLSEAPSLRQASASATLAWDSANVADLQLGPATLSPTLRAGTVSLRPTDIPVAGGKLRLAGDVDLTASPPVVRMDGVHPVLSDARVTPELSRQVLSRINPIFYDLAAASGVVNVSLRDVRVPLDANATRAASGSGRIEAADMTLAPAGLLAELLTIAGATSDGKMVAAGVRGTDFRIDNGRLAYRDLTLVLPKKLDLRFSGSVGLDGTLDLAVSVPMSRELLGRLGVKKDVARYAEALLDERVEIPITGTREKPILEFVRINTEELLERALKGTAEDALRDALDDLLRGKKKGGKRGG